MPRSRRTASVTFGLALAGALAGALACWLALAAFDLPPVRSGYAWHLWRDPQVLAVALPVGAALGALVGPAVAWGWLRRVPIGAAVGSVTLGAWAGALLGLFALPHVGYSWLWGALAGVGATAAALRRGFRAGLVVGDP